MSEGRSDRCDVRACSDSKTKPLIAAASGLMLSSAVGIASEELLELSQDDSQWVMSAKNYASTRYSGLDQINTENIEDLTVPPPIRHLSGGQVVKPRSGSPSAG